MATLRVMLPHALHDSNGDRGREWNRCSYITSWGLLCVYNISNSISSVFVGVIIFLAMGTPVRLKHYCFWLFD